MKWIRAMWTGDFLQQVYHVWAKGSIDRLHKRKLMKKMTTAREELVDLPYVSLKKREKHDFGHMKVWPKWKIMKHIWGIVQYLEKVGMLDEENDMGDVSFAVEARDTRGKGAARELRRNGMVPAVVYGGGREATAIQIDSAKFERMLETSHAGVNTLIDLEGSDAGGKTVIAKELQRE